MKYITIFTLTMMLSACQEFQHLNIELEENGIIFSQNEINEKCPKGAYITNFDIEYVNGLESLVAWSIDRGFEYKYIEGNKPELPFKYGELINGINTRSKAIILKAGTYNYGGSFACLSNNDVTAISVQGSYSIVEKNGNLKLIK